MKNYLRLPGVLPAPVYRTHWPRVSCVDFSFVSLPDGSSGRFMIAPVANTGRWSLSPLSIVVFLIRLEITVSLARKMSGLLAPLGLTNDKALGALISDRILLAQCLSPFPLPLLLVSHCTARALRSLITIALLSLTLFNFVSTFYFSSFSALSVMYKIVIIVPPSFTEIYCIVAVAYLSITLHGGRGFIVHATVHPPCTPSGIVLSLWEPLPTRLGPHITGRSFSLSKFHTIPRPRPLWSSDAPPGAFSSAP